MLAYYDLSYQAPSFAFMEFCCGAKTLGATKIVVNASQLRFEYARDGQERIESIIPDTCELFGLDLEWGAIGDREHLKVSHLPDGWISAYKKTGEIAKIKSPTKRSERFTVTLRDMDMQAFRNSNEEVWRAFAGEIGAFVIEDYARKKISLKDRLALYAGAEMNYFVVNGPMHLCIFSDYPYAIFMKKAKLKKMEAAGWPVGGQLWFAHEKQKCYWSEDSLENLRNAHKELCG